jgi:hypothetical protein
MRDIARSAAPLDGDDFHLALYLLYELHYRSFAGVSDDLEWDPTLLVMRAGLEREFGGAHRQRLPQRPVRPEHVPAVLTDVIEQHEGWSLSSHMLRRGTVRHLQEFAVHRSAYQLKEADPHTWVLPRLAGAAKAAVAEIQFDEYGQGRPAATHSTLFADTMRALGLDDRYGAHLPLLPGSTLATVNLISMFGLHRRLRGALVGHLATFEMTSVVPMNRYSRAMARLGFDQSSRRFYDEHVAADALHEVIARDRLVAEFALAEPALAPDIVFGADALMLVEDGFATRMRDAWSLGTTSLLGELALAV